MTELTLRRSLRSAATIFFAVLICILSRFSLAGPAAVLAGCILGGVQGAGASGLFLLAVASGFPLLPDGLSGIKALYGETGAYTWGVFPAALAAGLFTGIPHRYEKTKGIRFYVRLISAVILSLTVYLLCGFFQESMVSDRSLSELIVPLLYRIPAGTASAAFCVTAALIFRPLTAAYLYPDGRQAMKEAEDIMKSAGRNIKNNGVKK